MISGRRIGIGALVLLTTLLTGACTSRRPYDIGPDAVFDAASPDAIVVMGVKSALPDVGPLGSSHRVVSIIWGRLNNDAPPSDAPGAFLVTTTQRSLGVLTSAADDMTWHVVRVAPGTYGVYEVAGHRGHDSQITRTGTGINMPFFTVKPGEVRYIGDLHWDVKNFPARFVKLTRNDVEAKALLARYSGITVAPYFRPPAIIARAGKPAIFLTVAE